MNIAQSILEKYRNLNEQQKSVIGCLDGPLRVIAGPGSGKTFCIILRTLNMLLQKKAEPKEIILCTFTEKASFEMRDRLAAAARAIGYKDDLSELTISTIHGFCNRLLTRYRRHTQLGQNYETLNELTQRLFLYEHFDEIIGERKNGRFLGKWQYKWRSIEEIRKYLDKIADELVDPADMRARGDAFLSALAKAYEVYRSALLEQNRVDFAHLQRLAHDLLEKPEVLEEVTRDIRYLLVDEYQDTNYVQEQLLLKLAGKAGNLCVVGDEDQSIYRFRGATVRNILEFHRQLPACKTMTLTTNYRSHRGIVEKYDRWMASANWKNPGGSPFRYDKQIVPDDTAGHPDYQSVFSIWGSSKRDEAGRLAELVAKLKENGVITDYSQVALLLHSVRQEHSGHYLEAFQAKGLPAYCPRARTYFDNDEIRDMVACFAVLFGWIGEQRGEVFGAAEEFAKYVDEAIIHLNSRFSGNTPLGKKLQALVAEIANLQEGETPGTRPVDYFYQFLALEPFATALADTNKAHNLALFSHLLNDFQVHYHYQGITHGNRDFLRMSLFNSFFYILHRNGINEYEDINQPIPAGHVQVMTIHQAKGLEFPVVVVDSLSVQLSTEKQVDKALAPCYHRAPFEPEGRITGFDRMRQHYVAFSRAQNLLVLSAGAHRKIQPHFETIYGGLPQWPYVEKEKLLKQRFDARGHTPLKKAYGFTSDIRFYEVCPRQYEFFRDYEFQPSRVAGVFFGLLVHQAIEEIHNIAMDSGPPDLTESDIGEIVEEKFSDLSTTNIRRINPDAKEAARKQVFHYYRQNREEMKNIVEAEVDVSLEKDDYILTGTVDLIRNQNGELELLDFKTSKRSDNSREIASYERQLHTYAHILEQRHGRRAERLTLYWTGEKNKRDALMTLPNDPKKMDGAGRHFDKVVGRIQKRDFAVEFPPGRKVCGECDMRHLCRADGTIPKNH